jgi:hypothetical protein
MSQQNGRPDDPIRVEIRWRPSAAGGRSGPPPGPFYPTAARLADEPISEGFSVMVERLSSGAENGSAVWTADLRLLFPENFPDKLAKLHPGCVLVLHEGHRAVAEATVLSPAPVGA